MQMSFFKQCVGTSLQYCMLLHKTYIVHSHSRVLSVELHVMFLKIGARALLLVLQHEAAHGRHDKRSVKKLISLSRQCQLQGMFVVKTKKRKLFPPQSSRKQRHHDSITEL